MADNTEYLPQIGVIDDTRTQRNYKLIGEDNIVHKTSSDVVVNGVGNFVGEECKRVNILASSGCVVTSGVTDVSLINSSGVTVNYPGGVIYIDNQLVTADSFITSGVTVSQSIVTLSDAVVYEMTTSDYTVISNNNGNEIYLPPAAGQTQVFHVKNIDSDDFTLYVYPLTSDTIDLTEDRIVLAQYDTVTVQSDGSTNYYIL